MKLFELRMLANPNSGNKLSENIRTLVFGGSSDVIAHAEFNIMSLQTMNSGQMQGKTIESR